MSPPRRIGCEPPPARALDLDWDSVLPDASHGVAPAHPPEPPALQVVRATPVVCAPRPLIDGRGEGGIFRAVDNIIFNLPRRALPPFCTGSKILAGTCSSPSSGMRLTDWLSCV